MEFYKLKQILGDNGINNIAAFDGVKGRKSGPATSKWSPLGNYSEIFSL